MRHWRSRRGGRSQPAAERARYAAPQRPDDGQAHAVAWTVETLHRRMPTPSQDLDERILALIEQEFAAGADPSVTGPRERARRPRRARHAPMGALAVMPGGTTRSVSRGVALVASGVMCVMVVTLALGLGWSAPTSDAAVPSIPLATSCGSDTRDRHVVVAGVWEGKEQTRFKKILERFERTEHVQVTYAYQTHEIADTLTERVERGCPPDVALLPQPGLLRDFARRGALKPLDAPTHARVHENYRSFWRDHATVKGELYGVWLKAANKSSVWYNRRHFAAAGAHPPRTWRELQDVADDLRRSGIAPFSVAGDDGWPLTDWFENVYLRTAGRANYDRLARGELSWQDDTVRTALRTLAQVLRRPQRLAGGTSAALRTDLEESVEQVFSARAPAAMVLGDFVRNEIDALAQPPASSDVGAFAFPSIGGADDAVVTGGDVAVQFTAGDGARRLMRFLATPQAAEPWARAGGFISPNRELDPRAYEDPITRRLAKALRDAKSLHFDLSDLQRPAFGATQSQGMWHVFQRYLAGAGIDETMRHLQDGAR